jgi:hypothetical protein
MEQTENQQPFLAQRTEDTNKIITLNLEREIQKTVARMRLPEAETIGVINW